VPPVGLFTVTVALTVGGGGGGGGGGFVLAMLPPPQAVRVTRNTARTAKTSLFIVAVFY